MPRVHKKQRTNAEIVTSILEMFEPVPESWLQGNGKPRRVATQQNTTSCTDYKTLITSWRKALKWTDGLDISLSVMLASVASTMAVGDQLWIKIMGPAACGKSTLCEALSTNTVYIIAKSTIRGFHSGWKSDSGEDTSLIAQASGKTLITKDGDTLIQAPNIGQILAEGRDIYDTTSRSHYRNDQGKDYIGQRMTWILCGTASLRCIDQSELGERFLDCVIMDSIDDELEDEILWRVGKIC